MSNLRSKAAEIKAAGEAERGNFEPHGVPKRMYQYWLERSRTERAVAIRDGARRENFCHFWRVVAIWAPLMFLKTKFTDFADSRAGKVTGIVGAAALFIAAAIASGGIFPLVLLSIIAITAVLLGIAVGVVWLFERYWNKDWNKYVGYFFGSLAILIALVTVVFGLVMLVIEEGWGALAILAAVLAVVGAIFFALSKVANYISGKRAIERAKRREIINRWVETGEGDNPFVSEPREPGKISKFFSGVADFLILITQVVRVKKWKICPMVDIQN